MALYLYLILNKFIDLLGPTGFDRKRSAMCKHAGSWEESLERYSLIVDGENNYALAA